MVQTSQRDGDERVSFVAADSVTPSTSDDVGVTDADESRPFIRIETGRSAPSPPRVSDSSFEELRKMQPIVSSVHSCIMCREPADLHAAEGKLEKGWRVCGCEARLGKVVHLYCASSDPDWPVRRCLDCAQRYRIPAVTQNVEPRQTLPLSPSGTKCVICENKRPDLHVGSPKNDLRWIRPCFCDCDVHHICITERLRVRKICPSCGVKYDTVKYGSMWDFFASHFLEYICSMLLYAAFVFIATMLINKIADGVVDSFVALLLIYVGVLLVPSLLFYLWVSWTVSKRYPAFKTRYGQVSVLNYEPKKESRRNTLLKLPNRNRSAKTLRPVEEHSAFLRNWSLDTVYKLGDRGMVLTTSTPRKEDPNIVVPRFAFPYAKGEQQQDEKIKSEHSCFSVSLPTSPPPITAIPPPKPARSSFKAHANTLPASYRSESMA